MDKRAFFSKYFKKARDKVNTELDNTKKVMDIESKYGVTIPDNIVSKDEKTVTAWAKKNRRTKGMDKQAILEGAYQSAFEDEMDKIAVSVEGIERDIGTYLSDSQEKTVRGMIKRQKEKSWKLRHPVLSLGIGQSAARRKIKKHLFKTDKGIKKHMDKRRSRRHALELAEAKATKVDITNDTYSSNDNYNRYDS